MSKKILKNSLLIFFNIFVFIIIFYCNTIFAENTKILFKINNKAYTSFDYNNRIKYLDFIGDNNQISGNIIIEDFISALIFYEFYSEMKNKKNLNDEILNAYNNIKDKNVKNNKIINYEKNKNIFLENLKIDLIRKTILEDIINSNRNLLELNIGDVDLLYKFTINYININSQNIKKIKDYIEDKKIKNIVGIKKYLDNNEINYFTKSEEIINLDKINKDIKNKIKSGINFYYLQKNDNSITYIYVEKEFETFEGLIADIFSYSVDKNNENRIFNCEYLKSRNSNEIINQKYEFSKLNAELKNNLLEINDYVKFNDNEKFIYVVLCGLEYDKKILNEYQFSKRLNFSVNLIEKDFVKNNSARFNLKKFYE